MESSFTLSKADILCISLSLNALYFLQLVTSRLVHCCLPLLASRGTKWRTLYGLHQKWPELLGRLLMEQISLLILLVLVLVDLGLVSSVVPPFSRQQADDDNHNGGNEDDDDDENNDNDDQISRNLTGVILSANAARFFLIAVGILQNDKNGPPVRITSTNTRNLHLDQLYCIFSVATNIIGLGYQQNLRLLVTSPFLELSTTSLVICRLIKLADRHRCCRSYIKTSVLCCAAFLFSRVLLPVLFLCHALAQESPFVMGKVPLVWFFVSGVFYSVFHAIFLYYSIRRIVKAYVFFSEGATHTCSDHAPFSVCSHSERLINDIYKDCDNGPGFEFDVEKDICVEGEELKFKSKPSTKLRDLNYGFLSPCDNRNLCNLITGVEEEKTNFLQTKNISKNELVYKFLVKGDKSGQGEECRCEQCIKDKRRSNIEVYNAMDVEEKDKNCPST